ncbi:hypothetical protein G6045_09815 [Streptomyces sp. YC504]|uniref:Uncharacterized protein n=1 Tax=Streptomyces mesophilus TaxID=1775132 RepID=A0A6G4XGL1_9ACTN|nr:hypothetical protein [Streptomyces mesophilus]NGO75967.1 hypothetical protein [Streptomyces mesophilus]
MDVSIGRLHLRARVLGATGMSGRGAVLDQFTGAAARELMHTVLSAAFAGDEVVLIRELACRATVRADAAAGPDILVRSLVASAARLLRDHPYDDDRVVRFPDEAAFVAAYIHNCFDGQPYRWYFDAFRPFLRRDGSPDWSALLTAHRVSRWPILVAVRASGDLETLLGALGDDCVRELLGSGREMADDGWPALSATAAEIVRKAGGPSAGRPLPPEGPAVAPATVPPPDWRDPASLGSAVASVVSGLLAASESQVGDTPGPDDERAAAVAEVARRYDWFDHEAFCRALPTGESAAPLSPRSRQILADLSEAIDDPLLALDPARPASAANLVRLLAALVHRAPRWSDDELARALTARVLDGWEREEPGAPRTLVGPTRTLRAARTHDADTGEAYPPNGQGSWGPRAALPGGPAAVVQRLATRFPTVPVLHGQSASQTAAGLLLLRSLLDLGFGRRLLDLTGPGGEALLGALLQRWTGVRPAADPLLEILQPASCVPGVEDIALLATRRLLGQRLAMPPFRAVTVPYAADRLATVVVDAAGRVLPLAPDRFGELGHQLAPDAEDSGPRTAVAEALAVIDCGPPYDLALDLLAVACVHGWARWLPGFATASVPFLLRTVVRRPARVAIDEATITAHLPTRPHDIVLDLAGYLAPVEPVPELGGRRVHFVTGEGHAA